MRESKYCKWCDSNKTVGGVNIHLCDDCLDLYCDHNACSCEVDVEEVEDASI